MNYTTGYSCNGDYPNCTLKGLVFDPEYIRRILPVEIKEILEDQKGNHQAIESFSDIATTDFLQTGLEEIFSHENNKYKPWQIGEAISEFFLRENDNVRFWTHALRDLKNPDASSTGADIVGFLDLGPETFFVFGEVKTSYEERSPPGVVGTDGMKKQIKDLTKDNEVKDNLVQYLGLKVKGLHDDDDFRIDFKKACKKYIENKHEINLYGLLVRDRLCRETDLKGIHDEYKSDLNESTILKFLGLYIDIDMKTWNDVIGGL